MNDVARVCRLIARHHTYKEFCGPGHVSECNRLRLLFLRREMTRYEFAAG
jgi:hypothetical protein